MVISASNRKPPSRAKLQAYKKYWKVVGSIQDELNRAYIHYETTIGEVANDAQLSYGTVHRFLHRGRIGKRQVRAYSYFHGPSATTLIGVADALECDLILKPRNGRAK